MECLMSSMCPQDHYCEPSVRQCHHCSDICDPIRYSPKACQNNCPEFWQKLDDITTKSTATTTNIDKISINSEHVIIISVVSNFFLLLLCIFIILKKERVPFLCKNSTMDPESRTFLDKPAENSTHKDNAGISMHKKESFCSSNDKKLLHATDTRERDDDKHCPSNKMMHNNVGSPSWDRESTTPKVSSDELYKSDSVIGNDALNVNLITPQDRLSNVELPELSVTPSERNLNLRTGSQSAGSIYIELRSDPVDNSRKDYVNNSRNKQFGFVLQAYNEIDRHLHELSFIRGCAVGSDKLRIYVEDPYNLDTARQEIMNVLSSHMKEEVFQVEYLK